MDRPSLNSEISDLALVQSIAQGDERSLAVLYDRYSGPVYSIALRVLHDPEAAEEVLQDTFLRLWQNAHGFDPSRGSLAGWLVVSARNRAISRLRRRRPESSDDLLEDSSMVPADFELNADVRQLESRVKTALASLPQEQRLALELAYFEGLTQSEIAERIREPLGTIKSRLRAALQTLRRDLNL